MGRGQAVGEGKEGNLPELPPLHHYPLPALDRSGTLPWNIWGTSPELQERGGIGEAQERPGDGLG